GEPEVFLDLLQGGHTAASTRSSTDTSDPRGPIGSGRTFGGIPDTASATLTTAAYRSSFQGTTASWASSQTRRTRAGPSRSGAIEGAGSSMSLGAFLRRCSVTRSNNGAGPYP